MTRKRVLFSSTKLTAAAIVAAAIAVPATPGLGPLLQSNSALAQAQAGDDGFAEERVERRLDPQVVDADGVYETLGTTREEAEGATESMATAQYGKLAKYQAEVERNNLEGAAQALAVVARRPITEAMVVDVNTKLGIDTNLTSQQIAAEAAEVQGEFGQRTESGGEVTIITNADAVVVTTAPRAAGDYDANTVYEMLGTTPQQAAADQKHFFGTAQYGPLQAYQAAIERGNLDAAAENLAAVAKRPITEKLVTDVNTELGVDTTLTSQQVAEVAARKQQAAK